MAGYLHLFYEDYIHRSGDPAFIISAKKTEIMSKAVGKIQARAGGSLVVEKEFEQLYSLKEGEFANAGVIEKLEVANKQMISFDQAIAELKTLVSEQGTLTHGIELCNTCIESIDAILKMGANTHGLADSAYQEVQNFKQKMQSVKKSLRHTALSKRSSEERKVLLDTIGAIQSNISGYLLEIAWVYAFLGANKKALGAMMNIGGHNTNIGITYKEDPKMREDINMIDQMLSQNEVQSKADAIFNLHPDNVSATTNWVGFQLKNFSDIGSIHVGNYSLGEILEESGYNENFVVNIAGTLAGNQYKANKEISPNLRTYKENLSSQGEVDNLWRNLKNSTKPLGIADAIAGAISNNFTNKVNYYVIRSKSTQQIKVIPVSFILNKIAAAFQSNQDKIFGINAGEYDGTTKAATRSTYWEKNVAAFDPEDSTGQTRSRIAYSQVLNEINQTKISISVNFTQVIDGLT